jgi:hypothetical protein
MGLTAQDARIHQNDIINELSHKNFHIESLKREIALLTPKFESSIVIPKTTNIRNLTKEDLNVDVIPANLADMETVQARKAFYYAKEELANMLIARDSLINLYNSYNTHIAQELKKQAGPCTDEMIFDAYHKALDLKNLAPQEKEALSEIGTRLMVTLNAGKENRIELLETLNNLITQHS